MIRITPRALRDGSARAQDLFLLNRLRPPEAAREGFAAVYDALGVDRDMLAELETTVADLVPVRGIPGLEAAAASSMLAGVLVGLLIADSAMPVEELDLPVRRP